MRNSSRSRPLRIAVVGAAKATEEQKRIAYQTGKLIARNGGVVITGGRSGIMAMASKGAKDAGGMAVGILPGIDDSDANEYLHLAIPTGLGHARNAIIAQSADAVIAIAGSYGTLSEIALALKMGKPVYGLDTWKLGHGVIPLDSPETVMDRIFKA